MILSSLALFFCVDFFLFLFTIIGVLGYNLGGVHIFSTWGSYDLRIWDLSFVLDFG